MARAQETILKTSNVPKQVKLAHALAWAKATYGKGRYRQLAEMAALTLGAQKLEPKDYFIYGLFRPSISAGERHSYVSMASGEALNSRLSPRCNAGQHGLFFNKLLTGLTLEKAGFPVLEPLAVFSRQFRVPSVPMLTSSEEIANFLRRDGILPCFGKALDGSLGIGGASFLSVSADGVMVTLGDGREVSIKALSEEIVLHFPRGYLFQPLIRQHPVVEALNGPAVGMFRTVTLRTKDGIGLLYSALKMPAKGLMIDAAVGAASNAMALVDPATGAILRAQDLSRLSTSVLENSLATGASLAGAVLPHVREAVKLSIAAHEAFPGHGILGFDIALAKDGPILNEINSNPHHHVYQRAADRGLLNPEFLPRLKSAEEESRRIAEDVGGLPSQRRPWGKRK
ncbi:sugar-transfer associated ATP-grasp domain-containing protein [Ostreiculturibacter nitratireducens]|uniref:sugar-transfer associated ATP-grasp domain-containing protein n=1 Tax=Ostreiculturibacter nitratireducens TaxID=3075226 RepID=UPI0031B61D33